MCNRAAEFHFEVGDAGEVVRFERFVCRWVDVGYPEEVIPGVAVGFRVTHDLPLKEVRCHEVAVVVGGGAVVVGGGGGEVGGD